MTANFDPRNRRHIGLTGLPVMAANLWRNLLAELPAGQLGQDRALGLPAFNASVSEMIAALRNAAGGQFDGLHRFEFDPAIAKICQGWPAAVDGARALALGLPIEDSLEQIVQYYIEDYVS